MWPDLAKFRHFGEILLVFGNFFRVYLVLGTIFRILRQILCATGQFFSYKLPNFVQKSNHLVALIAFLTQQEGFLYKTILQLLFNYLGPNLNTYFWNNLPTQLPIFFCCWHAIQLVFLSPLIPLKRSREVYCCFVNLWSMSMATPFMILKVRGEDRSPTLIPPPGITLI